MAEEVAVDSTVYNLAGDEDKRPNYMQALIFRNIISSSKESIADSLIHGHIKGPGIALRSFFRWADANYGLIGMPTGNLAATLGISNIILEGQIPPPPSETVTVTSSDVGTADYARWAEQWLLLNYPAEWGTGYTVEIDLTTSEIMITTVGAVTYTFIPTDFNSTATYIYAYYTMSVTAGQRLFIYRIGSGNLTLDAAVTPIEAYGKFFPYIPIRLKNEFLSSTHLPDKYELAKKAFKKATGGKLDEVIDNIAENGAIDDIDYAYTVFGVAANVQDNSAKKYIYNLLTKLMNSQLNSGSYYTDWLCYTGGATSAGTALALWNAAQSNPASALYKTPPPNAVFRNTFPFTNNTLKVTDGDNLDLRLLWTYISTGGADGLGKVGAKVGDLWFVDDTDSDAFVNSMSNVWSKGNPEYRSRVRLIWQISETEHIWLRIVGLSHFNYIYKSYAVKNRLSQSWDYVATGDKPKDSGFIFPLHYGTFVEMPLTDSTQMSTACVFLVFNAYSSVTIPWWQSAIFQILLIVVIAIASAVFTGGAGLGILGANLAVGTSLGFTGLTAAIVGSVANALAAVALTSLIGFFANSIFGEEIGALVTTVLSFVIMNGLTSFNTTGVFNLTDLFKVDTLMMLMDATGNAYTAMVSADIKAMEAELKEYINQAGETLDDIKEQYYAEFGYGIGYFNPVMFTSDKKLMVESGDTFLSRTLMTGSDIAELTLSVVNDFTNLSLTLPKAYS